MFDMKLGQSADAYRSLVLAVLPLVLLMVDQVSSLMSRGGSAAIMICDLVVTDFKLSRLRSESKVHEAPYSRLIYILLPFMYIDVDGRAPRFVTKVMQRMCKQCVPGSLLSFGPGYKA